MTLEEALARIEVLEAALKPFASDLIKVDDMQDGDFIAIPVRYTDPPPDIRVRDVRLARALLGARTEATEAVECPVCGDPTFRIGGFCSREHEALGNKA